MRNITTSIFLSLAIGTAAAQVSQEDHSAHHPPGSPSAQSAAPAPTAGDAYADQMDRMRDIHRRLQAATTPQERQALMAEQMKLMHAGMEMMSRMQGAGAGAGMPMGMGMAGAAGSRPQSAPATPQGPATGPAPGGQPAGMMAMHASMERRMALMEQMMQMMVDRETAMPRK
jgi:hypothetical protein